MSSSVSKKSDDFWRNYIENVGPLPTPSKRYGEASRYDAMWIMTQAILEANSSQTEDVKKILPQICKEYQGVIGNCTLDENGDRISTDYDVYRWIMLEDKAQFIKIGHYNSFTNKLSLARTEFSD